MKIELHSLSKPIIVLLVSALLFSCGGSSQSSNEGYGSFSLSVTDAPVDYVTKVFIDFSGVTLKPAEGEPIEFLFETPINVDVLQLQGAISEGLILDEQVPAGRYNWIRLHVNAQADGILDSYAETDTGTFLELDIPSGNTTGLKLVNGFTVLAGGSVDFTVDIDLRKSLVENPQNSATQLKFKPTLRLIDNARAGDISGLIDSQLVIEACEDPANEDGAVYVFQGADALVSDISGSESDPLLTALVNYDGENYYFDIGFLAVGDYTLAYTCEAALDDPEAIDLINFSVSTHVEVEEGVVTQVEMVASEPSMTATNF